MSDNMEQLEQINEKPKKGFSFDKYVQQLQQMDMSNIGAWPASVKFTMYVLILVAIGFAAYFAVIQSVREQIAGAESQQENLLNEFRDKDSKLRNLQSYQAQVELMEVQFNQQLEQLPKETEIAGLVEDINMAGVSSGLDFQNISLLPEVKQAVFIEQPIDITVLGNYHSMGGFVSAIAALPRIVTLHDLDVKSEASKGSEVPKLSMTIKAKTYRYMTEQDKNNEQEAKK